MNDKCRFSFSPWFPQLSLTALCVALLVLPGCKDPNGSNSGNGGTPPVRENRHSVHIGTILPMTGPASQYGKWVQQGIGIGLQEAKKKYPDVDITVTYEDSQGAPKNAVSIFQKFAMQKVDVVFVLTSGETLAIAPLAEKNAIVIISGTLIPGITDKSPLLIRNAANMATETKVMAEHLSSRNPKPKVAIIYVNNDVGSFSRGRFVGLYEKAGGTITGTEAYMPDANDFRAQLTKLRDSKPDVLYFLSYSEWATIARQARQLGMTCQFAGATPTEDAKALKIAGDAAESTIYTKAAFDPQADDEAIRTFQKQYKDRYGEYSEVYAATFRDNLMLVAEAASKGHTRGKEMIDAILAVGTFDGASGHTKFLPDRDVDKPVALFRIDNGEFTPWGNP